MTSVLRDNFEETFPEIEEVLRKSAFVSIDTEFSGLVKSNDFKSRYEQRLCSLYCKPEIQVWISITNDAVSYSFQPF